MNDEPRLKAEITRVYRAIQVSPEVFEKGELLSCSSREYDKDVNNVLDDYEDTAVEEVGKKNIIRELDENGRLIKESFTIGDCFVTHVFNANGLLAYDESKDSEFHCIRKYTYDMSNNLVTTHTYSNYEHEEGNHIAFQLHEYIHHSDEDFQTNLYQCNADSLDDFLSGNFTKILWQVDDITSSGEIIRGNKVICTKNFYCNDRFQMRVTTTETYPGRDMLLVERIELDYNPMGIDEWIITEEEIVYWEES